MMHKKQYLITNNHCARTKAFAEIMASEHHIKKISYDDDDNDPRFMRKGSIFQGITINVVSPKNFCCWSQQKDAKGRKDHK